MISKDDEQEDGEVHRAKNNDHRIKIRKTQMGQIKDKFKPKQKKIREEKRECISQLVSIFIMHANTFSAMVLSKLWSEADEMIEVRVEWMTRPEGERETEVQNRGL